MNADVFSRAMTVIGVVFAVGDVTAYMRNGLVAVAFIAHSVKPPFHIDARVVSAFNSLLYIGSF